MKICPKCQAGNSDEMVLCRECGVSLGKVSAQDREALLKTETEKYERRQRRSRNLALVGVILSGVLNIFLFITSIIRGTFFFLTVFFLFTPVMGYFFVFRADALFRLSHFEDFENIDDVRLTDWYYFKNMIGGILVMVMGTIMMGVVALH